MSTLVLMRIRRAEDGSDYLVQTYDADIYHVRTFVTGAPAIIIAKKTDPSDMVFVGPISDFYVINNSPEI
jgi:hypothetical protein